MEQDVFEQAPAPADPTPRAVFAQDSAAHAGIPSAGAGRAAHRLSGAAAPDAAGRTWSACVGCGGGVADPPEPVLLVGPEAGTRVRRAAPQAPPALPEAERVTLLRLRFVGPRQRTVSG